ncbi:MAG TPA: hypothetical protein VEU97_11675 [Ktedonobacteraceae bacterium]|nr:hypothetical protein [Ktedonobacteraceae bacterium]
MYKRLNVQWCLALFLSLVLLLVSGAVPVVFAAVNGQPPIMGGTAGKLYLALGDSLAFGYQPNRDFRYGYVDDLMQDLTLLVVRHCPISRPANIPGCAVNLLIFTPTLLVTVR